MIYVIPHFFLGMWKGCKFSQSHVPHEFHVAEQHLFAGNGTEAPRTTQAV